MLTPKQQCDLPHLKTIQLYTKNEVGNQPVDHKGFWKVVCQWIPRQCATLGNDMIDTLDKEGLDFPSPEHPTTNQKATAKITKNSALLSIRCP